MKKLSISMFVLMALSMISFAAAQDAAPAAPAPAAEAAAPATPAAEAVVAEEESSSFPATFLIPFGCGLVVLGGGLGIGKIGSAAVDSMARQPEYCGPIQTAMILSAALVEGVTLFALVICLLGYIM